jgi:hypothetical protein
MSEAVADGSLMINGIVSIGSWEPHGGDQWALRSAISQFLAQCALDQVELDLRAGG